MARVFCYRIALLISCLIPKRIFGTTLSMSLDVVGRVQVTTVNSPILRHAAATTSASTMKQFNNYTLLFC